MPASLAAYRALTALLEPLIGLYLKHRVGKGKERTERIPERMGRTSVPRPDGPVIWMHGASVGETALLADVFERLRARRPALNGVITSQTLTSADRIADRAIAGLVHQMAPADGPRATARFMDHWRPDVGVFAEGEIWPNLVAAATARKVPLALINARMTEATRRSWLKRRGAAQTLFGAFSFIGAADAATADAVSQITDRPADVVGNLKRSLPPPDCDAERLARWRDALAGRRVFLAASTHEGEDELALDAFSALLEETSDIKLILAPRHPERGAALASAVESLDLKTQRRAIDKSTMDEADVLIADTIGEMGLWLRLADAVYLGGGHAPGVGGHNPIEPLKLRRPTFSGPDMFNFADLQARLTPTGALVLGEDAAALSAFWRAPPETIDWASVDAIFAESDNAMTSTLGEIETLLDRDGGHA